VGYQNTIVDSLYPPNTVPFRLVRAAGGLAGYAHGAGANFAADLALENVDFVEVNDLNAMEPLYRAWNCGSRVVASAGEDAFPNFYRSYIIGSNRVYVKTGKRLDYDEWIADFRAGHAFVSSGPLVFFTLEGKGPGEDIGLAPSHHQLHAAVEVESITPIETVELLCNNRVIDAGKLSDQPLRYRFVVAAIWYSSCSSRSAAHRLTGETVAVHIPASSRRLSMRSSASRYNSRISWRPFSLFQAERANAWFRVLSMHSIKDSASCLGRTGCPLTLTHTGIMAAKGWPPDRGGVHTHSALAPHSSRRDPQSPSSHERNHS